MILFEKAEPTVKSKTKVWLGISCFLNYPIQIQYNYKEHPSTKIFSDGFRINTDDRDKSQFWKNDEVLLKIKVHRFE